MHASILQPRDGDASRAPATVVMLAAAVSLLLSPITAVWAIVVGVPAALLASGLDRAMRRRWTRTVLLIALGVVLGAVPYFLAAALIAAL